MSKMQHSTPCPPYAPSGTAQRWCTRDLRPLPPLALWAVAGGMLECSVADRPPPVSVCCTKVVPHAPCCRVISRPHGIRAMCISALRTSSKTSPPEAQVPPPPPHAPELTSTNKQVTPRA